MRVRCANKYSWRWEAYLLFGKAVQDDGSCYFFGIVVRLARGMQSVTRIESII
jgi:hypothetical protein